MSISLNKGGSISLAKEAPTLSLVKAGLGWDERTTTGAEFDLDASVLVCDAEGRCLDDSWFIFYGQLHSPGDAVVHQGDNRTGEGEGDDEVINVELGKLPPNAAKLVFVVSIHEAEARNQNFGQVQNAFIRMVDAANDREIVRYDLAEDYSTETAMLFGELAREGSDWQFRATGQGYSGGLAAVIRSFGLSVS